MPLYICNAAAGEISAAARAEIAADITRIHCDVTGAPAKFVHTAFLEDEARFPRGEHLASVVGTIRQGRSDAQKAQIAEAIQQSLQAHAGIALAHSQAVIVETPASWVMEGGDIMPEPGEEAAWLAAQEARHAADAGRQ